MSYNGIKELSFAEGYYSIDARGIVSFKDDTPEDIIEKFWEVWADFHKMVAEREKNMMFSSEYPILPLEDPIENKKRCKRR